MNTFFEARYPGTCGTCSERIKVGDPIEWEDDEVVHADCVGKLEELTKPPCTSCWMVHAGECM